MNSAHVQAVLIKDHKIQQEAQQVQIIAKGKEKVQAEVAEGNKKLKLT